ncbi:MAG: Phage integrase [Blastococcus sp.]|nr:Phage integrase [Blastococcus sp.]
MSRPSSAGPPPRSSDPLLLTPGEAARSSAAAARGEDGQRARDRTQTVAAFALHWMDTSLQAAEGKQTTKARYAGIHIIRSSMGRLTPDRIRPWHVEAAVIRRPRATAEEAASDTA